MMKSDERRFAIEDFLLIVEDALMGETEGVLSGLKLVLVLEVWEAKVLFDLELMDLGVFVLALIVVGVLWTEGRWLLFKLSR